VVGAAFPLLSCPGFGETEFCEDGVDEEEGGVGGVGGTSAAQRRNCHPNADEGCVLKEEAATAIRLLSISFFELNLQYS
jgi:hypothetical protein